MSMIVLRPFQVFGDGTEKPVLELPVVYSVEEAMNQIQNLPLHLRDFNIRYVQDLNTVGAPIDKPH